MTMKVPRKTGVCVCVCVYLRCGFGKNVSSLNDVSHHSVLQLLVLYGRQLDGF